MSNDTQNPQAEANQPRNFGDIKSQRKPIKPIFEGVKVLLAITEDLERKLRDDSFILTADGDVFDRSRKGGYTNMVFNPCGHNELRPKQIAFVTLDDGRQTLARYHAENDNEFFELLGEHQGSPLVDISGENDYTKLHGVLIHAQWAMAAE